ncbi:MAG: PIN domain-containing protein [Proteobacteria bacterium]|nr:PIN domain-containing protein [Pseudomonadota bacterium]
MTVKYLFDTNICIYIRKQKPQTVLAQFKKLKPGEAAISVITWGELLYGTEKNKKRERVFVLRNEFVVFAPVLSTPEDVGKTYGAIRTFLESKGLPIGNSDLWIAAHAKVEKLTLITNSEKRIHGDPRP